jgi:hypothetical protein
MMEVKKVRIGRETRLKKDSSRLCRVKGESQGPDH